MNIDRDRVFQLFKYSVYALLTINVYLFFAAEWSADFDEYAILTAANCASFSTANTFLQYSGIHAVVDPDGSIDIIRLARADVINATVWILVVLVLEINVRLQERQALEGMALKLSKLSKYVLYSILFLAAIYWGVKGDFVDFWDAFLWLVAFFFIELNVFEWQQEDAAAQNLAVPSPP